MNITEYPDREMLSIDVANVLAGELESHLLRHDSAAFAVSGGNTPGPIFDALCAADLDWDRVHVMATDERWVPEDNPRSNARMIRERLLVERAAKAQFLSFHGDSEDPAAPMNRLNDLVEPLMPLSLVMLGMGPDMHTASLFPGAPELAAALADDAPALLAQTPPTQNERRITLSARTLNGALGKHLVITGQDKRDALERALSMPPEDAPVNAVLSGTTVHWAA
jgi:6-phosphogluconolactonase